MKRISIMMGVLSLSTISFSQTQNWKVTGNSITPGDYLGTSNNEPLIFKANDNEGLRIKPNGELRVKNFDDNTYTGITFINTNGVLSKLNFTGNSSDVLKGDGTFGSVSSLSGWTFSGSVLYSNYNIGIGTNIAPEKLTVNGNILANGSISGTSLNVVDIVTSGKEFKISTSLCLKGVDVSDPNSRNEICGMNGDLYIQSENANYNTIINKGNLGKVGIGVIPTESFHVGVKARFEDHVYMNKIISIDSVFTIGSNTLNFVEGSQNISGGINGPYKGLGLGVSSFGLGKWATAIGYRTRANGEGAITIGSGSTTNALINTSPYTLFVGFNSNIPTLTVTPANGNGTYGNVGIATSNPKDRLQIGNDYTSVSFGRADVADLQWGTAYIGFNATRTNTGWQINTDGAGNGAGVIYSTLHGKMGFSPISNTGATGKILTDEEINDNLMLVIHPSKQITIGTDCPAPGYTLSVDGRIITEEVNVQVNNSNGCWPDYVFEENYNLPSLEEIENYININHHLPEIPSALEIETNGVNLGEMNKNLLKKTEELTLYIIQLSKRIDDLSKENIEIKKKLKEIENR